MFKRWLGSMVNDGSEKVFGSSLSTAKGAGKGPGDEAPVINSL